MIKAVIFDMDGVLIEAKEWHYEALNKALRLFGYEISRFDHLSTYDGLPTRRKLEMLTVERGLPKDLHEFINEIKQIYTMEIVHAQCKPKFTQEYALAKLKSAGYKLGLASNSIRSTVSIMMQKARLDNYFDVNLSSEDVARAKPDPEIYLRAINKLNVLAEETLVVEDNENGIKAAKGAGAHVLVVSSVEEANFTNIVARIRELEKRSV